MKLLILTQVVDREDPILGFFHGWIRELAKRCEQVTVICLRRGSYDLPGNVRVLSLGKEEGRSRIKYLFRFYRHLWHERKNYDEVFVHMNAEYVVLGGWWWKLWGKKIKLWNNHERGNFWTSLGVKLGDRTFYTSPFSFNALHGGRKGRQMPVGIDPSLFKVDDDVFREPHSLLFLGRISPIKRLELLIEALNLLVTDKVDFVLNIVGNPGESDEQYYQQIKSLAESLEAPGKIKFERALPNYLTPRIYQRHEIFINLTNSGSLDKSIVESAACGCLLLVSNRTLESSLPPEMIFRENDVSDLKTKIVGLLGTDKITRGNWSRQLSEWALANHSLTILVDKLLQP